MSKTYDMYKKIETPEAQSLLPCPCCGAAAELWRYAASGTAPSTPVAMCTNGDKIGPQDGLAGEGCVLYMPPDNFYRATIREAVKYWNDFAKALEALQRKNRWKTAGVLRDGTECTP